MPRPFSRTGVFKKSTPMCSWTGNKCNKKVKCCSIREASIKRKWAGSGVCTPQSCAPRGGRCLTRTPFYTGSEFMCCSSKDACLFPKPGSISGTCLSKSSDTTCVQEGAQCSTKFGKPCCEGLECDVVLGPFGPGFSRKPKKCLPSGETCTDGGAACCPSLKCTVVAQGIRLPDGVFRRICFDENCSTEDCSKGQLCCPGWGCAKIGDRQVCVPPTSTNRRRLCAVS